VARHKDLRARTASVAVGLLGAFGTIAGALATNADARVAVVPEAPDGALTSRAVLASASAQKQIPAHFVVLTLGCGGAYGVEFARAAGAVSYAISYYDGYYKGIQAGTFTEAQLAALDQEYVAQGTLPAGQDFLPVTGGGSHAPAPGSPPCPAADPTEGGRFAKGATVLVTASSYKLSGRVLSQRCTPSACTRRPRSGVQVVAIPLGSGSSASATTKRDGSYSIEVEKGTYEVSLRKVKSEPAKQRVVVTRNAGGVDFRVCAGAHPARVASSVLTPFRCDRTLIVTVTDAAGRPIPNVTVLARGTSLLDIGAAAEATTNAGGFARLDLYDTTWEVFLARSLEAINPTGTKFTQSNRVPIPSALELEYPGTPYIYDSHCDSRVSHPRRGGGCVFDLGIGNVSFNSAQMHVRTDLVPVDVSLGAGFENGSVLIFPEGQSSDSVQWAGAGTSISRLVFRFEGSRGVVDVSADGTPDIAKAPATVVGCTPGQIGQAQVGLPRPACRLSLGDWRGGGPTHGAAAFSLSHG
jgi:hypothetical protein